MYPLLLGLPSPRTPPCRSSQSPALGPLCGQQLPTGSGLHVVVYASQRFSLSSSRPLQEKVCLKVICISIKHLKINFVSWSRVPFTGKLQS